MAHWMKWGIVLAVLAACVATLDMGTATAASKAKEGTTPAAPAGKVDLNTATLAELEALPGIGAVTAKKIIDARPYKSVADLAKSGIPAKTAEKITPLVAVGAASTPLPKVAPVAVPKPSVPSATSAAPAKAPTTSGKVDLNTATQAEIEKLPGIGPVSARKIIDGRPYAAVSDVARTGIPPKTIDKISSLVTVSPAPVGKPAPTRAAPVAAPPASVPPPTQPVAPAKTTVKPVTPPVAGQGMVWVNPDSKVYHKEGDHWYGKTKQGSYLSEAEAVKQGYHPAKTGAVK